MGVFVVGYVWNLGPPGCAPVVRMGGRVRAIPGLVQQLCSCPLRSATEFETGTHRRQVLDLYGVRRDVSAGRQGDCYLSAGAPRLIENVTLSEAVTSMRSP